jgi:hypothetical protein
MVKITRCFGYGESAVVASAAACSFSSGPGGG